MDEIRVETAPIGYGIVQPGQFVESGILVLAIHNLGGDYRTNVHRSVQSVESQHVRSRVQPGDVLISVKGTIGRVDIVPEGFFGNISRDIARIRLRSIALPRYVQQTLLSPRFQALAENTSVGTTRAEISIWILKQLRLALPPLEEQERITDVIDTYDRRISLENIFLSKLKEQKKGLMHDLLTGQVRVTHLKEIPA